MKGGPVVVTWLDARSLRTAWTTADDAESYHDEGIECETVGFVVKRDRNGITVAQSRNTEGSVGNLWHVPAPLIRKVRRLR